MAAFGMPDSDEEDMDLPVMTPSASVGVVGSKPLLEPASQGSVEAPARPNSR